MRNFLLLLALFLCAPLVNANTSINPSPYDGCGTLVQSGTCVLFQADNGNTYDMLEGTGPWVVGDYIHVVGEQSPCFSSCGTNACIFSVTLLESCVTDATIPFCDNSTGSFFCPCGNFGAGGEGCQNSTGAGAILTAQGSARIGLDDLFFSSSQLPPNRPALLFSGDGQIQPGQALGDGLRCAGGSLFRFGVRIASNQGTADWGPGLAAQGGWQAGTTISLQVWYRDPVGSSPCGTGFNLSGGRYVALIP
jgi:hypothetical protein